ncbi:hypothetical protein pEaSNUABM37_00025 [Erwinia phage pEa_SNUABM_37]|nr:hypothetical protein pEaSNUABM37_00025 [Erwinia phage pEa_SNUABM_37]QXO10495.1 hypothetical protein pEaSNUABM48_00025 [Erwinia phage pEa_SNUABM_48]
MIIIEQRHRLIDELDGPINVALQKRFAHEVIGACVNTWNTWSSNADSVLITVEQAKTTFNELCHLPMLDIVDKYCLGRTPIYHLIRNDIKLAESNSMQDLNVTVSGLLLRLLEGDVTEVRLLPGEFWLEKSEAEVRAYYQQLLDQPCVELLNIKKDPS